MASHTGEYWAMHLIICWSVHCAVEHTFQLNADIYALFMWRGEARRALNGQQMRNKSNKSFGQLYNQTVHEAIPLLAVLIESLRAGVPPFFQATAEDATKRFRFCETNAWHLRKVREAATKRHVIITESVACVVTVVGVCFIILAALCATVLYYRIMQ